AVRSERRAEEDLRRRLVGRAARERDDEADDGTHDQADCRQPPAGDDGVPVAPEVDLLLDVEFGRGAARAVRVGAHRAPTLEEAHSHWARKPSSSETRGCHPSCWRMRLVSAAVRRASPAAVGSMRTSSVLPEMRSARAIASSMLASEPPPTL